MKYNWTTGLTLCATLMVTATAGLAQFTVDWFTIDGGGGGSTNGAFSVIGTIGQPDSGVMTNANFKLVGGFWGVVSAIQTPGAPLLSVNRSGPSVVVSWPLPENGWKLHFASNLTATPSWTEIPPPYSTNTANFIFTEAAPAGNRFYQLHKP